MLFYIIFAFHNTNPHLLLNEVQKIWRHCQASKEMSKMGGGQGGGGWGRDPSSEGRGSLTPLSAPSPPSDSMKILLLLLVLGRLPVHAWSCPLKQGGPRCLRAQKLCAMARILREGPFSEGGGSGPLSVLPLLHIQE